MNASIVLFPAWPCDWDVDAKLWGPGNTSVRCAGSSNGNFLLSPTLQDAHLPSPPLHTSPLYLFSVLVFLVQVEFSFKNRVLLNLTVTPISRTSAVKVSPCDPV
jgi:hypothetical protein